MLRWCGAEVVQCLRDARLLLEGILGLRASKAFEHAHHVLVPAWEELARDA